MKTPSQNIRLTLEGKVLIKSEKMLIIDPCYLEKDYSQPLDDLENLYDASEIKLLDEEERIMKKTNSRTYLKMIDNVLKEAKEKGKLTKKTMESIKEMEDNLKKYAIERQNIEEKIKQLRKSSSMILPNIAQTDNYIFFANPIGDGSFPIVKNKKGIYIIFGDQPKTLRGRTLGYSGVESATQVIADPADIEIKKEVSRDLYAIINVSNGLYECKFINNNDALSITKK
ncbi:MAG: hypothetical protein Q7S27_03940 [Nanoarchaeota archaeon]|nr:hypothetical protein [Nanoarchaeota archaeon]